MKRKAIIIGATGRVGQELTRELAALYDTLIVIARAQPRYFSDNMYYYQVSDFANLTQILDAITLDKDTDAFCCLWMDAKDADSDEALHRIHYQYPLDFARVCAKKGVVRYFLLSTAGANAQSADAILKAKGELEQALIGVGFGLLVGFCPSKLTLPDTLSLKNITKKLTRFVTQILPQDKPLSPKQIAMSMALIAYQTLHHPNYIHTLTPITPQKQAGLWVVHHKQMLALVGQD